MKCKVFEPSIIQDRNEVYIDINEVAKIKGLKSNRSIRIAIQKGKYIAREKQVFEVHLMKYCTLLLGRKYRKNWKMKN